jgi:hypothetical protein
MFTAAWIEPSGAELDPVAAVLTPELLVLPTYKMAVWFSVTLAWLCARIPVIARAARTMVRKSLKVRI